MLREVFIRCSGWVCSWELVSHLGFVIWILSFLGILSSFGSMSILVLVVGRVGCLVDSEGKIWQDKVWGGYSHHK